LFIQLSDVIMGGATAFPYLKLKIPTVKGAAAFWYNLRDSGADHYYTRHAGCPVLYGSKTVMNKWIHGAGQEFRRLCKPQNFTLTSEYEIYREFL
jgi:prolyl 4-hydroxylase